MTTKPSNIGQWIGAVIAAVVIIGASFLGSTRSTLEPTRTPNFSPGHSHPSLTTPRNPAPNRETPLKPQNQHPLRSRSPLPRLTFTRAAKLVPKRHHSGTSTYGHMRSIPETQKTS